MAGLHRGNMIDMSFLIALLAFVWAVAAVPATNYPINAQLPPVARVSKPFKFSFSDRTFVNGGTGLTYSLSNAPGWLQIDAGSRTLYGTPGTGDAGAVHFGLIASDQSGSANMSVTLVISSEAGPGPGESLLPQLAKAGPTSNPSTVFMYPGRSFSLAFNASDVFTNTDFTTIYYATSPYNSPLPSWIGFDPSSLTFSGNSPSSPSSGPQSFNFNIIASDVAGFSAATVSFDIVVGQHITAFNHTTQTVNFTRGQPFSTPHFIDDLTIDGHRPTVQNLSNIKVDGPGWLKLDNDTISLSGTAPEDAGNENVTVTVTDIYQDTTTLDIRLRVSQLFFKGVESCNATTGEDFSYTFDKFLLSDDTVKLDVDLSGGPSWVNYNVANRTLYGHVPADLAPKTFSIKLIASQGSTVETRNLNLNIFKPGQGGDVNDQSSSGSENPMHKRMVGIIAVSVVVPFVVIVTMAILSCWWRRRRQAKAKSGGRDQENPATPSPKMKELPKCQPDEQCEQRNPQDSRRSSSSSSTRSVAPRLELGPLWETDSLQSKEEGTLNTGDQGNQLTQPTVGWDFARIDADEEAGEATKGSGRLSQTSPLSRHSTRRYSRREPLKPIQPRSFKRDSALSSKSKRYSRRSSGLSSVASGLPLRLSGAGHGAGGFGPPGHGIGRMSWQTTQMSFQSDDTSIENLATMFPRPPPARTRDSLPSAQREQSRRVSIRFAEASSPTRPEADSLEAFIQGRAKSRNSGHALFSSRMNSRGSSGFRALDKARRSSSVAETAASVSTSAAEDHRQSLQVRPISTAMSASVYTEDFRHSTQLRPLSQATNFDGLNVPRTRGSQPSLVQRYTDAIAQLPRFWSQGSLGSTRRFESADSTTGSDDYYDLIDEREDHEGRRQWYRVNSHTLSNVDEVEPDTPVREERPSVDESSSRVRRMSLMRIGGHDSSPAARSGDRYWRLAENQERRPVSIEESGLPRATTGSFRGDLAFV
jgi:axial budding pattern protein 2